MMTASSTVHQINVNVVLRMFVFFNSIKQWEEGIKRHMTRITLKGHKKIDVAEAARGSSIHSICHADIRSCQDVECNAI